MLFAICSKNVGADASVRPPTLHRTPCKTPCHCETSDRCHWLWQSASPSPRPPCLRGLSRQSRAWGDSFLAPTAGHAGPALQSVALPGLGGQGRPPLRSSIGKRCVGADAYIGPVAGNTLSCVGRRALTPPPNLIPHPTPRKKRRGPHPAAPQFLSPVTFPAPPPQTPKTAGAACPAC